MPKAFLDSNILLYSLANDDARKQAIATELVSESLRNGLATVSSQVIQECLSVITRKALLSTEQTRTWLSLIMPICSVFPTEALFELSLDIHERYRFGYYDSSIIAAALAANCRRLLTEDLQPGQSIEGLKVVNPFL